MAEPTGQLILDQNQYAFLQDATKGTVAVYAGPYSFSLSGNDRPVIYDRNKDAFVSVDIKQATMQNAFVPEGHYLVLENPSITDKGELRSPVQGSNSQTPLQIGRKIVISGPATFPLFPGQFAQAIPGHHLRSNQYLVVRVYNADEAGKNAPAYLVKTAQEDSAEKPDAVAEGVNKNSPFTPGELLVIKGTEVSFFIPPTGFEVLKDETGQYVREALTLERLEYCNLLDEDGNKRIERGPAVVFPEATERFVTNSKNDRKSKAIELNDQMGLYIKVIADYNENGKDYNKTGDELFITGKEQRIYYPRSEHALIEYDDPTKGIKRQRYYGITIPKGEGRYVLDKNAGVIEKKEGPKIFLPDPRNQVIVRRVLDDKTVNLWYPNNSEALAYNQTLRSLTEDSSSYLAESMVLSAAADVTRGMNRGTVGSKAIYGGSYEGDKMTRGGKFTPPPMLTLSTKYDGIPAISVYTGYAVQVVNKSGDRRVEVGPTNILLEYDETLEVLELSTGKPKTTDRLKRDVYLRVDNNLVSDIVRVETKDMVEIDLKLSYRVNFDRESKDKWFSVENYVKYLCDHMRSLLKAAVKNYSVKEVYDTSATIVRDTCLGKKTADSAAPRHRFFAENGMDVYDVELLGQTIVNAEIAALVRQTETRTVETAITLAAKEQNLVNLRRTSDIDTEIAELENTVRLKKLELARELDKAEADRTMQVLMAEVAETVARRKAEVEEQEQLSLIATAELTRTQAVGDYELKQEEASVALFEKKMAAIAPNLIQALTTLGETHMLTTLSAALAPLALTEQSGLGATVERVFKGTPLEAVLNNMQKKSRAATASNS